MNEIKITPEEIEEQQHLSKKWQREQRNLQSRLPVGKSQNFPEYAHENF